MKKFIGTKDFYRKVMLISVPIIVQNGITNFVGMLDNIMVGQIGTDQMSGVAIVNQLMFVFNICVFGGISGAGIFTAQFYGKGDHEGVKHTFRFKAYASAIITLIGMLLFSFMSRPLISLYLYDGGDVGNIANTLVFAQQYLFIMMLGMIPFAISQIYASTLRECGETIVPMLAGVIAVIINLCFNYVFIFGNFGAPALGAKGAAVATVIARFIECGIIIAWTHRHKEKNTFIQGVYKSFYIPSSLVKNILRKGLPLMLNEVFWATGMAVILQCYSYRGLLVIAAFNITFTIVNVFSIVFISLGNSVSILVGQLLGAGKKEEARQSDTQLIAFSVASSVLISLIMACFSGLFPQIYKTEPEVKQLATQLILVSALVMPFQAFTHATYFTLRSGGRTIITFLFDSVFVWCFVIPLAFLLCRYTALSTVTVYLLVQATEVIKCVIGFIMVRGDSWLVNIIE